MTRLKKIAVAGIAALAISGAASSAWAEEPLTFQNRLTGATAGLPLGALPPPGLYTGITTAYLGMVGQSGKSTGNFIPGGPNFQLPAVANAVPILYVPGWNFLGATYAMSAVQAFYVFTTCGIAGATGCGLGSSASQPISGGGFVFANTLFNPITLSWNLGGGLFTSLAFNFMAPDGTKSGGPAGMLSTPNPDYWTLEPAFAVSYLGNNWVLSGNFFYDINTKSQGTCCGTTGITSGNLFYGDLTALYKFGKWSLGPVGAFEVQTTADTGPGCGTFVGGQAFCANYSSADIGGLVGYDFGPVDLQVWASVRVAAQNAAQGTGGVNVWTRWGFKLWGPEAPKPLVAKN
jgi:hypothetical protein